MPTLPDFRSLKMNHPWHHDFLTRAGGTVADKARKNGWSTCACQLSWALNHAAAPITAPEQVTDARLTEGHVRA